MTGKRAGPQGKGAALRLLAGTLILFALSGCALGGMGRDGIVDPEAPLEKRQKGVDRLVSDLQGSGEQKRARAAELLPQYGSLAVPPLVEIAASGDLDDRLQAISLLGEMGAESRGALPFLIEALENEDEFIRLTAAEAVGRIPVVGEGSIPALRTVLSDTSPFVRIQAQAALVSLYRLRLEDRFLPFLGRTPQPRRRGSEAGVRQAYGRRRHRVRSGDYPRRHGREGAVGRARSHAGHR